VKAVDLDRDGALDVVITSNAIPHQFGETPTNYIFKNDGKGNFKNITSSFSPSFEHIGCVTYLEVADLDGNGFDDLVVVGTWMPVTLFLNNGRSMSPLVLPESKGWWKSVAVCDFDKDGDLDIVAGNWGDNTRLSASPKEPIHLYRADFDNNGNTETLITYFYRGKETPIASKDELAKQLPFINKRFLSYHDFAVGDLKDIFPQGKLERALKKEATTLFTSYYENKGNNKFSCHILPIGAQESSVNGILIDDFNNDDYQDIFLVGNNYEISPQLGRLDASHGVLLLNDQSGFFKEYPLLTFNVAGAARDIQKLKINRKSYYVVTINNGKPVFLEKEK